MPHKPPENTGKAATETLTAEISTLRLRLADLQTAPASSQTQAQDCALSREIGSLRGELQREQEAINALTQEIQVLSETTEGNAIIADLIAATEKARAATIAQLKAEAVEVGKKAKMLLSTLGFEL